MTLKKKDEITKITKSLVKEYKAEKIVLFGSHATGTANSDSDFDLLVIKSGVDHISPHKRITQAYKAANPDSAADIVVYTPYEIKKRLYLEDPFIKKVLKEGTVLYGT